jgi:hypothetical protein
MSEEISDVIKAYRKREETKAIGYMDKVDYDYHLGHDIKGARVYPSIEVLKEQRPCVAGCGIVEVEVTLRRVVEEGNQDERIAKCKARIKAEKEKVVNPLKDLEQNTDR